VREFLEKHLPSTDELIAEEDLSEAEQLLAQGDTTSALAKLQEALAVNPANDDARFDYVKLLIAMGELETAHAALAPALAQIPLQLRFDALHHWLQAMVFATTDERGQWELAQFDALIEKNKRDFDTRLAKARLLMAAGQWTQAMDELLEIIMRDKAWSDQTARKHFVAILELLTPPKPKADAPVPGKSAGGIELTGKAAAQEDPQAELLSRYRRRLSMALN
jgi:putative thioredoxin